MAIFGTFVGNNYDGSTAQLYGCDNDARDWLAALKPYCRTTKLLVGGKADRETVFLEVAKMFERGQAGDLGVITISGHGTQDRSGKRKVEAVVFADFELGYDHEWAGLLSRRPKGMDLAIVGDLCHARGQIRGNPKRIRSIPVQRCRTHKIVLPDNEGPLPRVAYYSGCGKDEYCYDAVFDGRANGAMTHYALEVFRKRRDRTTFYGLSAGIKRYLPNEEYDQTPGLVATTTMQRRSLRSYMEAV